VAAPPAFLPPFPPARFSGCVTLDSAAPPLNLRRPPWRTHEKHGGMPPHHPGPEGRGYQQPRPMNRPLGRDGPPAEVRKAATSRESAQGEIRLGELPSARQGERPRREPGTGNRKRRTGSEVAIMARTGQVLPPVPAPGKNTLCRVVLFSIAFPELPANSTTSSTARDVCPPVPPKRGHMLLFDKSLVALPCWRNHAVLDCVRETVV